MMLADLSVRDVDAWLMARMEAGQKKYGDAHLHRHLTVDITEELYDALNIHELLLSRISVDQELDPNVAIGTLFDMFKVIELIIEALTVLEKVDEALPDRYRDDTKGGERVWWSERARRAQDESHGAE